MRRAAVPTARGARVQVWFDRATVKERREKQVQTPSSGAPEQTRGGWTYCSDCREAENTASANRLRSFAGATIL